MPIPTLKKKPLTLEELVGIRDKVRLARPIAERVVALVVASARVPSIWTSSPAQSPDVDEADVVEHEAPRPPPLAQLCAPRPHPEPAAPR